MKDNGFIIHEGVTNGEKFAVIDNILATISDFMDAISQLYVI